MAEDEMQELMDDTITQAVYVAISEYMEYWAMSAEDMKSYCSIVIDYLDEMQKGNVAKSIMDDGVCESSTGEEEENDD